MAKTPAAPSPKDVPTDASVDLTSGKGHATPSRAEQEAARKRPLVPDTKEAKARAKADLAAQRDKARAGMAAGDDRYLTARDKGPQRKFARDYVDSGWHLGEAVMPAMILVILVTFVQNAQLQVFSFLGLWMFIFLVIGDMIWTSFRVKRAARAKFGDKTEKGLGWYAAMRSIQMRFLRLPKPQVTRRWRKSA